MHSFIDEELMIIQKNFSTFIPVQNVTGVDLASILLETLKTLSLNLDKIHGEGYDRAATIGGFRGVQAIVRKIYPKTLYTHYIAHSLNFCLSNASKTQDIRHAFGIVLECCKFFYYSAKRTSRKSYRT